MKYFLQIDYDEGDLTGKSYNAVVIIDKNSSIIQQWKSGDAVLDWRNMIDYVIENQVSCLIETSSVQHFAFDSSDYYFDEDDMIQRIIDA